MKRVHELINFKEKQNNIFATKDNLEYGKSGFIDILFCALREGVVTAYRDENFTIPFTFDDIYSLKNKNTNKVVKALDLNDIKAIKIKEDWIIDKNFNIIDARIIGICPMIIERDTAGDFVRNKPMFWIYFPDLRNILVYADIKNKANPADKITWDDVFIKRLFKGTVVKESNTKNRNVTDYTSGKDATIESEQIKGTNQDMDQDLKEY